MPGVGAGADAGEHGVPAADHWVTIRLPLIVGVIVTLDLDTRGVTQLELLLLLLDFLNHGDGSVSHETEQHSSPS